ncbi:LysM domain-containing protein [Amycolatopsis sp. NPDC059021]|uniref:LysM domain-containing protein n=1 Tax=Amycolatopsis sp. NPDC059021 TaxID=3346704 RepID=UPI00366D0FD5
MLATTSRYQGIPTAVHETADGRKIVYLRRRILPHPEDLAQIGEHTVKPGERLDNVAAKELGDAERFWQVADANRAMDPAALTVHPGRKLRITLAPGTPGGSFPLAVPGNG